MPKNLQDVFTCQALGLILKISAECGLKMP